MEEEAEKIFNTHQKKIKAQAQRSGGYSGVHDISTNHGRRGAAMDYMHDEMKKDDSSDDDFDKMDF